MRKFKLVVILVLAALGLVSLGGCVVHERRDGGVTVRPIHYY